MFNLLFNFFGEKKTRDEENQRQREQEQLAAQERFLEEQKRNIIAEEKKHIRESAKRITKLKYFADLLKNEVLTNIYNQTVILHEIFENDSNLQRNKLEQHHYMYTDNLLQILEGIEKNVEKEIQLKDVHITKTKKHLEVLVKSLRENEELNSAYYTFFPVYTKYIITQLSSLYNILIDEYTDYRFVEANRFIHMGKRVNTIHVEFKMNPEQQAKLIASVDKKKLLAHENFFIDAQLLKDLYEDNFILEYKGVFRTADDEIIEVFKDLHTEKFFYFSVTNLVFGYILDSKLLKTLMVKENTKIMTIKKDIEFYESELKTYTYDKENALIREFTPNIKATLKEFIEKIDDIEFIEQIKKVDVDTQHLRTMLGVEKLEI